MLMEPGQELKKINVNANDLDLIDEYSTPKLR